MVVTSCNIQHNILCSNHILVYTLQVQIIQLDEECGVFRHSATFDHPYPTTKIMWIPDVVSSISSLLTLTLYSLPIHIPYLY